MVQRRRNWVAELVAIFFSSLEVNSDCRVDVMLDLRQLIEINSARHVAPFRLAVPELKLEFGSRIGGLC
jgi:hypothetical protein